MNSRKRPRLGRRTGSSGESRDAILAAARELFATRGFRGTTTRAIAERAGVDIALIGYFFESKAKLFSAVIEMPALADPLETLLANGKDRLGERMLRLHLEKLFVERRQAITALLRAVLGDPDSIPMLRSLIQEQIVAGAAGAIRGPHAKLRAELAGAMVVGLFICREMVGVEPLASTSVDRIVALLGRPFDELLSARRDGARSVRSARRKDAHGQS